MKPSNTPPESIVEVRDVRLAYGSRSILDGIDLDIPRGKVVGILGVSGCGKTSLMRMIGGQLAPDHGTIKVAGEMIHELDDRGLYRLRRKMGMMFQAGGLFSDLSVFENIAFPAFPPDRFLWSQRKPDWFLARITRARKPLKSVAS